MGTVHEIKEQKDVYEFVLRNRYTGELTSVRVDEDKIHLFSDDLTRQLLPEACPFFRLGTASGEAYCTVHLTRPEICGDFGCWKFLIQDHAGDVIGRVFPPRMLVSQNTELNAIWERQVSRVTCDSNQIWDRQMKTILTGAGYKVIQ